MSIELLALVKNWLLPPGGLVLLLLLGLLLWHRLAGRLLVVAATASLYLVSTPALTGKLAEYLETAPVATAESLRAEGAQAILVLLAGRDSAAPELAGEDGLSPLSLFRLHHGVRLHRQTGLPLALSGGLVLPQENRSLAIIAAGVLEQEYRLSPLVIEGNSRNTRENLLFSKSLLEQAGIRKVALVTSAWHLPRALLSAEQAGLDAIPAGTGYLSDLDNEWGWTDWLPSGNALAANRHLLHEMLGILWYRLG